MINIIYDTSDAIGEVDSENDSLYIALFRRRHLEIVQSYNSLYFRRGGCLFLEEIICKYG